MLYLFLSARTFDVGRRRSDTIRFASHVKRHIFVGGKGGKWKVKRCAQKVAQLWGEERKWKRAPTKYIRVKFVHFDWVGILP